MIAYIVGGVFALLIVISYVIACRAIDRRWEPE